MKYLLFFFFLGIVVADYSSTFTLDKNGVYSNNHVLIGKTNVLVFGTNLFNAHIGGISCYNTTRCETLYYARACIETREVLIEIISLTDGNSITLDYVTKIDCGWFESNIVYLAIGALLLLFGSCCVGCFICFNHKPNKIDEEQELIAQQL